MKLAIIGHEDQKFTREGRVRAIKLIRKLIDEHPEATIVSGRCHLGGVDLWAEVVAQGLGRATEIYPSTSLAWEGRGGFKGRNERIVRAADHVHVIVVREYPPDFKGQRFPACYHCNSSTHIKSGACWTAKQAQRAKKTANWFVVEP